MVPAVAARHPRWSRLGRLVHDVHRAVDFVVAGQGRVAPPCNGLAPPEFDPKRVYLLGYSVGGLVALHAAALDQRVSGVACFSGLPPLRRGNDDARATGGLVRFWQWHALAPKLGLFEGREADLPYDTDDLLRLIAPRPCLIVAPAGDRDHPVATCALAWSGLAAPGRKARPRPALPLCILTTSAGFNPPNTGCCWIGCHGSHAKGRRIERFEPDRCPPDHYRRQLSPHRIRLRVGRQRRRR
jgi:pimeloyl-ACP methyl ester carboxylesterase